MSNPFNVTYPAGGNIDYVRRLPYPHFSKFTVPYIKGQQMLIPGVGDYTDSFTLPFNTEFLSIAFASNMYCIGDYWELEIGDKLICERIYAKELPESVSMGNSFGIVFPVEEGTEIRFKFHSATMEVTDSTTVNPPDKKVVWYNVKFLRPEDTE